MEVFTLALILSLKREGIAELYKSCPDPDFCVRKSVRSGEGAGGICVEPPVAVGREASHPRPPVLTDAVHRRAPGDAGGFRSLPAVLLLSAHPDIRVEGEYRTFSCTLCLYLPGIRILAETEEWPELPGAAARW